MQIRNNIEKLIGNESICDPVALFFLFGRATMSENLGQLLLLGIAKKMLLHCLKTMAMNILQAPLFPLSLHGQ